MRRRNRNRDGVNIDFTSLLDVIFILLMVVLCSTFEIESRKQEKDEQVDIAKDEDAKQLYEDGLKNFVYPVSVSLEVPFDPEDATQRQIRLLIGDDESIKDLQGNDTADTWEDLETELDSLANQFNDRPIIVTIGSDKNRILYRDEQKVKEILDRVTDEHNNIYLTN